MSSAVTCEIWTKDGAGITLPADRFATMTGFFRGYEAEVHHNEITHEQVQTKLEGRLREDWDAVIFNVDRQTNKPVGCLTLRNDNGRAYLTTAFIDEKVRGRRLFGPLVDAATYTATHHMRCTIIEAVPTSDRVATSLGNRGFRKDVPKSVYMVRTIS